jgi:hypothetical protein
MINVIPAHSLNFLVVHIMVIIVDFRFSESLNGGPIEPIFYPKKVCAVVCEESCQKILGFVIEKKVLIFFQGNRKNERFKSVLMASGKFFRA